MMALRNSDRLHLRLKRFPRRHKFNPLHCFNIGLRMNVPIGEPVRPSAGCTQERELCEAAKPEKDPKPPPTGGSSLRGAWLREKLEKSDCILLRIPVEIQIPRRSQQGVCMNPRRLIPRLLERLPASADGPKHLDLPVADAYVPIVQIAGWVTMARNKAQFVIHVQHAVWVFDQPVLIGNSDIL